MSRILRRPMFRGGKVDSRGTGITTGLDQPRIGARTGRFFGDTGNPFVPKPVTTQGIIDAYTPRGLPQSFIDFFKANQANQRPTGRFRLSPGATLQDAEGLLASNTMMTDDSAAGIADINTGNFDAIKEDELINVGDVELGLPKSKIEDLTTEKVVEKVKDGDDEVEVTMTDLEKALGLDKARRRDLGDMLGRASAAFLGAGDVREGLADFMAAEAKAGPSRTERIKSIAGLEEYKAKKAKEIAELKLKNKTYAPGNAQKNYEFFLSQGVGKDQALNLAMGKARNFDEAFLNLSAKGTVTAKLFDTLARQEGIDALPNVDIETLEVGETFYVPGQKTLIRVILKEGKKDLIQTPY